MSEDTLRSTLKPLCREKYQRDKKPCKAVIYVQVDVLQNHGQEKKKPFNTQTISSAYIQVHVPQCCLREIPRQLAAFPVSITLTTPFSTDSNFCAVCLFFKRPGYCWVKLHSCLCSLDIFQCGIACKAVGRSNSLSASCSTLVTAFENDEPISAAERCCTSPSTGRGVGPRPRGILLLMSQGLSKSGLQFLDAPAQNMLKNLKVQQSGYTLGHEKYIYWIISALNGKEIKHFLLYKEMS
ncbi:uncharacterized protein LOC116962787 [Tyto alba]|uniref:uncharacterized protein LOC116962787 n=1 Tax=Tyto alba TaxID=56313 RepID=UPI001C686BD0|nr:uncharacterized protein LOC116962787 [Tyto alba]